jgi:Sulfatase
VTSPGLGSRLGPRTNTSAANNASWLVAVGILAVVIPASEKVAANEVFFAAHGVSPLAWVVLLVGAVVLGWLVAFGILALLRSRLSERSYDIVASLAMLAVTWFFVGNVLARTLLSGVPILAPVVGLVVASAITLLARRLAMGTLLVVFAGVAAAVPLVMSNIGGSRSDDAAAFTFDSGAERPSVLWVVSDELQYPLAFDADGTVRPELPNLRALQQESTTYTRGYSAANYTDYAVPSMLSGISDVAGEGPERMQDVRAGLGIVPGLSSEYSVVMESPIYSFDCDTADCASVGSGSDVGPVERYVAFAKDTAAIAGRTALASPFSELFPSLDGKWRDFWSGGDEFGDDAEGDSVNAVISGIAEVQAASPTVPFLAFWHTIRTHAPWNVDREGRQIFPSRVPIVPGAHMLGSEADQTYTTDELKSLQRRLYANAAVDFDRQLGELIASLKESGSYDSTMIIVTADHGATMTDRADRRVGDTLVQRWSEVAHVPLMVKAAGQTAPEVVTAPRSTGQIAASVVQATGATPSAGLELSPDLSSDLPAGPVFTTVAGGGLTPWAYEGVAEVDPWQADDLTPPDPRHPFAIGIDADLLGAEPPADWVEVQPTSVEALPGESDLQAVIVDRASADCGPDVKAGLVTLDGTVVGSVLWEGPTGSSDDQTRGWAILPKANQADYSFFCPSSSSS